LFNCILYRNETVISNNTLADLPAGIYVFKANISDTANYTNYQATETFTLNRETSSCSLSVDPASPINYETQMKATCSCNNQEATPSLYRNEVNVTSQNNTYVTLGYNSYSFVCNVTQTANYTSATTSASYTINKKDANTQVSPSDQTMTYPVSTVLQYCADNSNFHDCKLYKNNTDITSENNTNIKLPAGAWGFKANITDQTNYTNYQASSTVIVSRASSSCNLTSSAGWSLIFPASTTLSCECNNSESEGFRALFL